MNVSRRMCRAGERSAGLIFAMVLALVPAGFAQGDYIPQGGEYGIVNLPGHQVYPDLGLQTSGGYLVWQDSVTDGSGLGISARRIDSSQSGSLSVFRVNQIGDDDQERPQVVTLPNGGAAFVWQGGKQGFQHIYARFLTPDGLWTTGDVMVNTATNVYQLEATATALTNGNVVVAWSSFNQAASGSLRDIYYQILSSDGQKVASEARANQTTGYNQRSAAVAALSDGRYVIVWISEQQRFENSVDVYGRIFNASGIPATGEFLINSGTNVCASPSVAAAPDGGFAVTWMERDLVVLSRGWEVYARPFSANAVGGVTRQINSYTEGDQFGPKICSVGNDYFVVWTSVGQDGSREGVYGQFLRGDGSLLGAEQRINTTVVSQQLYPAVASDGRNLLVVWSSFVGGSGGFDLFGQRFISTNEVLNPPGAPFVSVLDSTALSVAWSPVEGLSVSNYEVYVDGAATATVVTSNIYWRATGFAPGSSHTFRLAYVLSDGRRSPLSESASGTTYQYPFSYGGIPYDWMIAMWGSDVSNWPGADLDSDGDGVSNLQEFLQGTDPKDPNSVLRYQLRTTMQGLFLDWNTQPGLVYQVQYKEGLQGSWIDFGGARFAAGTSDSIYVGQGNSRFFRIGRVR